MKKKYAIYMCVCALVLALITGCSQVDDNQSAAVTTEAATTAATTKAATTKAATTEAATTEAATTEAATTEAATTEAATTEAATTEAATTEAATTEAATTEAATTEATTTEAATTEATTTEAATTEVATTEAATTEVVTTEAATTAAPMTKYQDGVFVGSGQGFNGPVTVEVTIRGDMIEAVKVVAHKDDAPYMEEAKALISSVISQNSAEVNGISGATYSSNGIKSAVADALVKALN